MDPPPHDHGDALWDVDPQYLSADGHTMDLGFSRRPPSSPHSRQTAERMYKELAAELAEGRAQGSPSPTSARGGHPFTTTGTASQSALGDEKGGSVLALQSELKVYSRKTDGCRTELDQLNSQVAALKERLTSETASRGGFRAVQENEAVVARALAILDKRIAKATVCGRLPASPPPPSALQGPRVCPCAHVAASGAGPVHGHPSTQLQTAYRH